MLGNRLFVANKKARKFYRDIEYWYRWGEFTEDEWNKIIGMLRKTRVRCSSYCCGNPRRHYGKVTRQEIKWLLNLNDWIDEC
jgi:hypothetical protein